MKIRFRTVEYKNGLIEFYCLGCDKIIKGWMTRNAWCECKGRVTYIHSEEDTKKLQFIAEMLDL